MEFCIVYQKLQKSHGKETDVQEVLLYKWKEMLYPLHKVLYVKKKKKCMTCILRF